MKNYKRILEAINRGIQFALDDFDDEVQDSPRKELIKPNNQIKNYIDLMNYVVDFGLPSGTLWAKYNLGVDINKIEKTYLEKQKIADKFKQLYGSEPKSFLELNKRAEDWYGDYYAWGEIHTKDNYSKDTYKFYEYKRNGYEDIDIITKYAPLNKNGGYFCDGLNTLMPEDDAAYMNMHIGNFKFYMPSMEQFNELIENTDKFWQENYKGINGLNGWLFRRKNYNDELFFPLAGEYVKNNIKLTGYRGHYWTNTCKEMAINEGAKYMYLDNEKIQCFSSPKFDGLSIRPVIQIKRG